MSENSIVEDNNASNSLEHVAEQVADLALWPEKRSANKWKSSSTH